MPRPPSLIVIFGPPAVGKTAVGIELSRITGIPLFHGHMTMDVLTTFFPFGSPAFMRLHRLITLQIIEEAAASGTSLVVTRGWRLDEPADTAFNVALAEPFHRVGGSVLYVELWAPLAVRLVRNRTPLRTSLKKTDWASDDHLTALETAHCYDSGGTLPLGIPHLRIDNTDIDPTAAAQVIVAAEGRY